MEAGGIAGWRVDGGYLSEEKRAKSAVSSPRFQGVFAYGSNMHTEDLRRWFAAAGHATPCLGTPQPGLLVGYELVWNYHSKARAGGAANVEPTPGAKVAGVVFHVNQETLDGFDAKEGHPHRYRREEQPRLIQLLDGGEVAAWVYRVTARHRQAGPVWPRSEYLSLLVSSAEEFALPRWYIERLQATPTSDR